MSTTVRITPADFAPPAIIDRMRAPALITGVVCVVIAVILAVLPKSTGFGFPTFMESWLVGFMFWLGVSLGSLALLCLQYTSGGNWGRLGRRYWEAASGFPLLLMLLCWIVLVVGMKFIYPWVTADPSHMSSLEKNRARLWLNPTLFIVRGVIYFALWGFWAWRLRRWSYAEEDGRATPAAFVNVQNFSGAGIVMYALTITFASVDWVMSLNPAWWSTVWGMLFMVGECLTAFAFTIWLLAKFAPLEPLSRIFKADYFHDFGKLMFAFVILWAYLSFAQWLIIWSGNLTEEIRWYLDRAHGHWKVVATALIFLHFVLPFAILLSRNLKRQPHKLVKIAIWMMLVRLLDLYWLVQPSFHHGKDLAPLTWQSVVMNVVNLLAIGGLWLWIFYRQLGKRAILPVYDPHFVEMLEAKHG
jgi:hypothetical protein